MAICRLVFLLLLVGMSTTAYAQVRTTIPHSSFGPLPLQLLRFHPSVGEAIGLTESQKETIRQIWSERSKQESAKIEESRNLPKDERQLFLDTELKKLTARAAVQLEEALTAEQIRRLDQVVLQQSIRTFGVGVLGSGSVVKGLGIGEEQLEDWRRVVIREQKRLEDSLQRRASDDEGAVLEQLTEAQRQRLDELYGEPFDRQFLPRLEPAEPPVVFFGVVTPSSQLPWPPALDLLRRQYIRDEIEIIDEQHQQIQPVLNELVRTHHAAYHRHFTTDQEPGAYELFTTTVAKLTKDAEKQVLDILLPHQVKRLKELVFQAQVAGPEHNRFRSAKLAEAIGLSAEEHQRLLQKLDQADKEAREYNEDLLRDCVAKCLAALTPDQQAKYLRMVGEPLVP